DGDVLHEMELLQGIGLEELRHRRQMIEQGRNVGAERDEHEGPPGLAADGAQVGAVRERSRIEERAVADAPVATVEVVDPVVERADEARAVAAFALDEPTPAVPADVEEGAQALVAAADHEDRLVAEVVAEE